MAYLKLKCTKFDFGWVLAGASSKTRQRSPGPLAEFQEPTSNGYGGEERI